LIEFAPPRQLNRWAARTIGNKMSTERISGYATVLARTRVEQQINKPLLGKPYLKYGQCLAVWPYFFQLGGLLGAKHAANLDAFGPAFLGARGASGAIENFFTEVAKRLTTEFPIESMTFSDYVLQEVTQRVGYTGDPQDFFLQRGLEKLPPDTATKLSWQYAQQGSALGAIYPGIIQDMFALTHAPVPEEEWNLARAAGLDIPAAQDRMTYEDIEDAEDAVFMEYCQKCCPDLHAVLTA
jgi:hypothetical protein